MGKPAASINLLQFADPVCRYSAGQHIFKEGEAGKHMYVVKSGTLELRAGERVLEQLHSGDVLGEMALLDGQTRSASAVAITDAELVPVDKQRFEYMVKQTPFFALEVMSIMARRLRQMNKGPR